MLTDKVKDYLNEHKIPYQLTDMGCMIKDYLYVTVVQQHANINGRDVIVHETPTIAIDYTKNPPIDADTDLIHDIEVLLR